MPVFVYVFGQCIPSRLYAHSQFSSRDSGGRRPAVWLPRKPDLVTLSNNFSLEKQCVFGLVADSRWSSVSTLRDGCPGRQSALVLIWPMTGQDCLCVFKRCEHQHVWCDLNFKVQMFAVKWSNDRFCNAIVSWIIWHLIDQNWYNNLPHFVQTSQVTSFWMYFIFYQY